MNGVVIIDKPADKTSHDVVSEVKKITGARKAGHTGTLDPMATGVLPVCLNEATKLAGFLSGEDKEYLATMLLGVKTDTMDIKGKIIATSDKIASEEEIRLLVSTMTGRKKQIPPAYSAVKHQGKPLYKWARKGVFPETPSREIEIFDMNIENIASNYVTFQVTCSKGTYIRTLCSDIGEKLGCGACLSGLRRLRSGFFSEEMAISLTNDENGRTSYASKKEELIKNILPMEKLMPSWKVIEVEQNFADKLQNGMQPSVAMMKSHVLPFLDQGDMIKFTNNEGKLIALAEITVAADKIAQLDDKLPAAKIIRVFNNINN